MTEHGQRSIFGVCPFAAVLSWGEVTSTKRCPCGDRFATKDGRAGGGSAAFEPVPRRNLRQWTRRLCHAHLVRLRGGERVRVSPALHVQADSHGVPRRPWTHQVTATFACKGKAPPSVTYADWPGVMYSVRSVLRLVPVTSSGQREETLAALRVSRSCCLVT